MKLLIIPLTLSVLLYFSVPSLSVEDDQVIVTQEQFTTAVKNTIPEVDQRTKLVTNLLFNIPLDTIEDEEYTLEDITTACQNTFPEENEVCQKLLANILVIQVDETIAALKEDE